MIHGNEVSWVQLTLIEAGAMLQLAALWAFMRDSSKPSQAVPGVKEAQLAHQQELKCRLPEVEKPVRVVEYRRELQGVMEDVPENIRPGNLVKTAKVSFKQILRPHNADKPYTPSARW